MAYQPGETTTLGETQVEEGRNCQTCSIWFLPPTSGLEALVTSYDALGMETPLKITGFIKRILGSS